MAAKIWASNVGPGGGGGGGLDPHLNLCPTNGTNCGLTSLICQLEGNPFHVSLSCYKLTSSFVKLFKKLFFTFSLFLPVYLLVP